MVGSQLGKEFKRSYLGKNPSHKRAGRVAQSIGRVHTPVLKKKMLLLVGCIGARCLSFLRVIQGLSLLCQKWLGLTKNL
jgi:hypothetical protein